MCGRARCTLRREEIAAMAGVAPDAFVDGEKYRPCENMGPGRYGPVTFRARDDPQANGERKVWEKHQKLQAMRWGLIPSFTKPHAKPDHFMMFNARSENLHERPAFRRLLETKRCIILSEGYYEWHQVDKREKQPYYIYRTTGPIKFAGLYDSWVNEDGERSYTYTILTTEVSPQLAWMHTRIPVILTDEGATRWLSDAKFDSLKDLLVGYDGDDLKWHPVDRRVGSTKFQSEDCTKKVDIKHAANITSFFASDAANEKPKTLDNRTGHQSTAPTTSAHKPMKADPQPVSHTDSNQTSQEDLNASSQNVSVPKSSQPNQQPKQPPVSPARFKPKRNEAFRSPIKFLFQQQHMVQQAEEILKATDAATATTDATSDASTSASGAKSASPGYPSFVSASAVMGTKRPASPHHPKPSPKKTKQSPKKPPSKNPQRGTLLAFFQPKS